MQGEAILTEQLSDKVSLALNDILDAKEKRSELRNNLSTQGYANLSLSLNIPGYPKRNEDLDTFFNYVLSDLKVFLLANKITINDGAINQIDGAGHFFLAPLSQTKNSLINIKNTTEIFETRHELGRLIDVDIFDIDGTPVSSGKKKACIICRDVPAIECMRNKTHSFEELRAEISKKVKSYNENRLCKEISKKISQLATKSLLYEVSLTPKPGLVDFLDAGSHTDMDYQIFINSTSALAPFWTEFAELGFNYKGEISNSLAEIREIGIRAEAEMFASTNGVNTQKGLVFLLGLSVFSAAYSIKKDGVFTETKFIDTLKTVAANLIETELEKGNYNCKSHGTEVFEKYGIKAAGARYQAQYAFPIIFEKTLPFLVSELNNEILSSKISTDKVLQKTLLLLISELDDTNVLYRKGIEVGEKLKQFAGEVLKNNKTYSDLCTFCENENISPGGSADMLAISLFIFSLKTDFN